MTKTRIDIFRKHVHEIEQERDLRLNDAMNYLKQTKVSIYDILKMIDEEDRCDSAFDMMFYDDQSLEETESRMSLLDTIKFELICLCDEIIEKESQRKPDLFSFFQDLEISKHHYLYPHLDNEFEHFKLRKSKK